MRLITHNMMKSHVKGVKKGYPLQLKVTELEEEEAEFNAEFMARMLPRIEYAALLEAVKATGLDSDLPAEMPEDAAENEAFLRVLHHALLEIHIKEGELVCPESGRAFPITKGVPNMLLNEDEV